MVSAKKGGIKMYMEHRAEDPYKLAEELNELEKEGWKVICPLSVGDGYLLYKEGEA